MGFAIGAEGDRILGKKLDEDEWKGTWGGCEEQKNTHSTPVGL